jgi:[acyl-carrier-protein] S-malonyltransferase
VTGPIVLFSGQGTPLEERHSRAAARYARSHGLVPLIREACGQAASDLLEQAAVPPAHDDLLSQVLAFLAALEVWEQRPPPRQPPAACAGYSSGLYAALVAAGWITPRDGLSLVIRIGQALLDRRVAPPGGLIAVIGLDRERLESLLPGPDEPLGAVTHVNHARQLIVASPREHLELLMQRIREAGALRTVRVPAQSPYHSPWVAPAVETVRETVQRLELGPRGAPIADTAQVRWARRPEEVRAFLAHHFARPVHWERTVRELLLPLGAPLVEAGPGDALGRMIRWVDRSVRVTCLDGRRPLGLGSRATRNGRRATNPTPPEAT